MKQFLFIFIAICLLIILIFYKKTSIAICSLSDRPEFTQHTWKVMKDYCSRHGYDFVTENGAIDGDRHQSWSKIPLIERTFTGGYDIVIWIDDDIVITERDQPVTSVFGDFINSDKKLAVARDTHGELANLGLICVKKTGVQILNRIYSEGISDENRWRPLWEQNAFVNMYDQIKNDVYIYPPGTIQGFYRDGREPQDPPEFKWRPGVWSGHVSGVDDKDRREMLLKDLSLK